MNPLKRWLRPGSRDKHYNNQEYDAADTQPIMPGEQEELREFDISLLRDEDGAKEEKLYQQAAKEVQHAAESSLKRMHVLRLGRCPSCGEHLQRHLFASICEHCGWHSYEAPRNGSVCVHLKNGDAIEGERCYFIKDSSLLVVKDDIVIAKIAPRSYERVEYKWDESEIKQRHRQLTERLKLSCGWCGETANPETEGFHLVHVAFGASQERFCFCSDECFEAFRKMYPPRVHRNCYDRECTDCEECIKRYSDGSEGVHALAKDFLHMKFKSNNGRDYS